MWQSSEIKQGDSGLVVSNKLDAEFQRIQTEEQRVDAVLVTLDYTDTVTVMDQSEDHKIVSPYTLWYVLKPLLTRFVGIEEVTDHLHEELFDGTVWIRTDVMLEYTGPYELYDDLRDGVLVTKSHLDQLKARIDGHYMALDGSTALPDGYVPVDYYNIATKGYVDDSVAILEGKYSTQYIEFPALIIDGQQLFTSTIGIKNIAVYVNGILWRSSKYSRDAFGITFTTPLTTGDEVTILVLGE